jgi:rare lipoprotein A (peptidoglycan hydrolase)
VVALLPPVASAVPSASGEQVAAAKSRIVAMQSELSSAMSDYDSTVAALARTRAEIATNRARLKTLNDSIGRGQTRLSAECVFLYRTDGNGFAEALLTSPSIDDFANRLLAVSRIAGRDAELIRTLRRDEIVARRLTLVLAKRGRRQAAEVAMVTARRAKAQSALTRQQRYADSLSASVSVALQADATGGRGKSPGPRRAAPRGIVWATIDGRSGKYAVLANQPKNYSRSGITINGIATWYGNVRPGMRTASGRAFDENELTCAHKTLPFGTRVAVTFRGKRVIVTVTDRGPYGKGRVIDVTKRAATIIGLRSAGVGRVHCEVVRPK